MGLGNRFILLLVIFVCGFAPSKSYSLTCQNLLASEQLGTQVTNSRKLPLRFMSYNVFNLYLHKGKFAWTEGGLEKINQDHLPNQKPEHQTQGVANAILQMNPDFLMLQEVEGEDSLRRFNREYLGDEYRVFMPPTNDIRKIGIAFLIRKNLEVEVEVENVLNVEWTTPKGVVEKVFSRNFPIFKLFTKGSDKPRMVVAGAHFKSQRDRSGDPDSYFKRQAEMKAAVTALKRIQEEFPGVPMTVMGDFNSSRGDNEVMPVFEELSVFDAHLSEDHFVDKGGLGHMTHTYHMKYKNEEQAAIESVMDRALLTESLRSDLINSVVYRYRHLGSSEYKSLPSSLAERLENPSDHFPIYFDIKPSVLFD